MFHKQMKHVSHIFSFLLFLSISACSQKIVVHKEIVDKKGVEQLDSQPEFNGGWEAFERYISKNLSYPIAAKQNTIQGTVVVSFVVRKDSVEITDIEIVESVPPELDDEAARLISKMPNWKPAIKDGEKVSVRLQIPVEFKL